MGSLGVNIGAGKATLIDINGDALPDVVDTSEEAGGDKHRFFINELASDGTHQFSSIPTQSSLGTVSGHLLSNRYVQAIDIDGDGFTDLINGLSGEVLKNNGSGDWVSVEDLGAQNGFPNIGEDTELRFFDYNNDKRIDVIKGELSSTQVFRNLGGSLGFVEDSNISAIGASFGDATVELADLNGDGLLDPTRKSEGSIHYRLNLGWGQWSGDANTWVEVSAPIITSGNLDKVSFEDLNGDSLDDLVIVSGTEISYALNRNGTSFDTPQTITSISGASIPERTNDTTVLYADMNGNGSTDIVWVTTAGNVTYLELYPVRPNLLSKIENNLGKVQEITYSTSVLEMARDREANSPWS